METFKLYSGSLLLSILRACFLIHNSGIRMVVQNSRNNSDCVHKKTPVEMLRPVRVNIAYQIWWSLLLLFSSHFPNEEVRNFHLFSQFVVHGDKPFFVMSAAIICQIALLLKETSLKNAPYFRYKEIRSNVLLYPKVYPDFFLRQVRQGRVWIGNAYLAVRHLGFSFATFCSFCPWEQNGWNGVLSIPDYECGIKERTYFTFWPFSFQNCE